jgi:hypothetical protein
MFTVSVCFNLLLDERYPTAISIHLKMYLGIIVSTRVICGKLRPARDWELLNCIKLAQHYKMH